MQLYPVMACYSVSVSMILNQVSKKQVKLPTMVLVLFTLEMLQRTGFEPHSYPDLPHCHGAFEAIFLEHVNPYTFMFMNTETQVDVKASLATLFEVLCWIIGVHFHV